MSEIYLTKIERKTIFTKSLIFVLIMFIISDLTVTGPFWFNFIPWMYILGLLGSIKKIDSILMSVIGTFTVFVSSAIIQTGVNLNCILSTVITLVTLVLGIITGRIIFEFILEHRLVKYIRRSKKTMYIVTIIIMFFASYFMVSLHNGDIFTYLKSKQNLNEYIQTTYKQDYTITNTKYSKNVPGKYVYVVSIDKEDVYFIPVSEEVFKDANISERLETKNEKLANDLDEKINETLNKYPLLKDTKVNFKLEYTTVAINPDTTVLEIETKFNNEQDQNDEKIEENAEIMDSFYEQLSNFTKELLVLNNSQRVVITVNDSVLQITNFVNEDITKDYIKGGFEVEEIE